MKNLHVAEVTVHAQKLNLCRISNTAVRKFIFIHKKQRSGIGLEVRRRFSVVFFVLFT